jgi:uncharacterized protein
MTDTRFYAVIAHKQQIPVGSIRKVAELLDSGATVPFLARYRREVTGDLDEEQLRGIRDELDYMRTLEDRKSVVLRTIKEQEKLTPELEVAILECTDMKVLEDLYLPYKPKRKTRASIAREKGLEPLASMIMEQKLLKGERIQIAQGFVDSEKGVESADQALQGARDICAEWINENAEVRDKLRHEFRKSGVMSSKKASTVTDRTVYEVYYEFSARVRWLKPHQILALNRGEREGVLVVNLEVLEDQCLEYIDDHTLREHETIFTEDLMQASEDAFKRLLFPALERELRNELTEIGRAHV